jgi:hypothetical protein
MNIGDPEFIRFKQSLIDQGANYETDEEYLEAFNNLVGYFDVLIQMDQEQKNKTALEEVD